MATVNKDFKIKHGLVVEGTTGTINGEDILTKSAADETYIIGIAGGGGDSTNTPNTIVKRDLNGNFAAGTITASQVTVGGAGTIFDDGDLFISTANNDDIYLEADDIRLNSRDDVRLVAGNLGDIWVSASTGNITLSSPNIYAGENVSQLDSERVATKGYVDDSIANIDLTFNTDEITEGTTNKYYSDSLVDSHLSGGTAITYSAGTISVDLNENGGLTNPNDALSIDRTTVDTWYDASGAASTVQGNLEDHASDTATHGVTGAIVGTSDTQTLTNKTVADNLTISDGQTSAGTIGATQDGKLAINANQTLYLHSENSNIDLVPGQGSHVYINGATAGNEVATHSYVDNAVSGLSWKQAVNLLAHTNIALTGDATSTSIDGHSLSAADGYRVLLTGQTTTDEKGIYDLNVTSGTYTLTRSEDADSYTELIGAAVYVMEGTTYGSTSWVQGDHYITSFTGQDWTQFSGQGSVTAGNGIVVDGLEVSIDTSVVATQSDLSTGLGTKQDTLTAGSNIDITGSTISVTGLASTDISDFSTAALAATSAAYDAAGAASSAETNANNYTNNQLEAYTPSSSLESTIDGYGFAYSSEIPGSTDSLTEGVNNLYYTDARAKAEAAALLTNATKSNIQISYSGGVLDIAAEDGVADSTTFDLAEDPAGSGTSGTWYFTDERAVNALEAVVPNFTAIEIDSVAKQVAGTLFASTGGSQVTAYSFAKADYRSAKFLVKTAYGTHTELTEVLITLDSSDNVAIVEYATVGTNGSSMAVTADVSGSDVRLRVTPVNNDSTITVVGTLLA